MSDISYIPQKPASKRQEPSQPSVGRQLKSRRQALKLSLAQVEIDTKIRGKFLTALESGDYSSLPNDVYSRGFVQHYANHLGLDGVSIAVAYAQERGGVAAGATKRPKLEKSKRFVLTGPMFAALGGLVLIVAVFGYLFWQFLALAGAPQLSITSPDGDVAITGADIDVNGHTTPGADVSINESPILSDTNGNFSDRVSLQSGVNVIRISSQSKLGKTSSVTRNVLATLPSVDATSAAVPNATFSGIAVAVSVNETTSMEVTVDGQQALLGTVLAGWSKVFTGTNDVNITTGNAGATSVVVTNSVVANKKLSPLGREGEIRRNQDFAKDTDIP
jgi:cytoskeletal protein RodZ